MLVLFLRCFIMYGSFVRCYINYGIIFKALYKVRCYF